LHFTGQYIPGLHGNLNCPNGGKHAYYRALRTFYNAILRKIWV